jgi:MFS superfamily sulfate permease-like transporter
MALILFASLRLIDVTQWPTLARRSRSEIAITAFFVMVIGVLAAVAVVLSIVDVVRRVAAVSLNSTVDRAAAATACTASDVIDTASQSSPDGPTTRPASTRKRGTDTQIRAKPRDIRALKSRTAINSRRSRPVA